MDYSYYPTPQAPYQFLGFTAEPNGSQQNQQNNGFTSPTSSVVSPAYSSFTSLPVTHRQYQNQHFDPGFSAFDHSVYDANNFAPTHFPNHRHVVHESPAPSISPSGSVQHNGRKGSISEPNASSNNGIAEQNVLPVPMGDTVGDEFMSRTRSSSEEKDSMTPAQTKRKAQNRAAYVDNIPSICPFASHLQVLICS